jgi:uncharacterized DUF497 family protein
MNEDDFEWDAKKAARNLAHHGITFGAAREVFDDPYSVERPDDREDYGEDRYNITGMVKGLYHPPRPDSADLGTGGRTL